MRPRTLLVRPLLIKSLTDHIRSIVAWSVGVISIVVVQLCVYPTIRDSQSEVGNIADAFPEAFQKIFRMQDYTSEVGYLSTELFTATLPLIFIAIAITWGARLTTEEEDAGTADILFALPLARRSYVATRFVVVVNVLFIVALALVSALLIGARILDFSIPIRDLCAGAWSLFGLGLVFCSGAAAFGALTGRRSVALGISATLAIGFFVLYSLAPLVSSIDALTPFNPLQWTIGSKPLMRGFDVGYAITIVVTSAILAVTTFTAFEQRDIGT